MRAPPRRPPVHCESGGSAASTTPPRPATLAPGVNCSAPSSPGSSFYAIYPAGALPGRSRESRGVGARRARKYNQPARLRAEWRRCGAARAKGARAAGLSPAEYRGGKFLPRIRLRASTAPSYSCTLRFGRAFALRSCAFARELGDGGSPRGRGAQLFCL